MTRDRTEKDVQNIRKALKKLEIKNGDTILIKSGTMMAEQEWIEELIQIGSAMGLDRVLITVVDDFDNLRVLDETAMATHGWYRLNFRRKQVRPIEPETK